MEDAALREGAPRIKFACAYAGALGADERARYAPAVRGLARAMRELERLGVAPVMPDGRVAGNGAVLVRDAAHRAPRLLVTPSGRAARADVTLDNVCVVTGFCARAWSASYLAARRDVRPSSDTPLLWMALTADHGWQARPVVALHGHALATDHDARRLGVPISPVETLFSTPDDVRALEHLLNRHAYPETNVFLRKGHGFFALYDSVESGVNALAALLK